LPQKDFKIARKKSRGFIIKQPYIFQSRHPPELYYISVRRPSKEGNRAAKPPQNQPKRAYFSTIIDWNSVKNTLKGENLPI